MIEKYNNRLFKNMFGMLVPMIFTNALNVLTYIINSIWIGNLIGGNGVAAIANCYPLTIILSAVIIAFVSAISVMISQYYGSNDKEKIKGTIGFGYIFSLIAGIIIALLIFIFVKKFLHLIGTPESIFVDAQHYILLYSVSFIFNFIVTIISESIRALGDAKIPLIFVGVETAVNVIAVPIFILTGLGIVGVGIANIFAKIIVLIIAMIIVNLKYQILKVEKKYLKVSKFYLKQSLSIGIPIMIEQYVIALVITLETFISNKSGVLGSAAYGVVARWEQVFLVVSQSIQSVITIFVGQYIGKKEFEKISLIMFNGLIIAIIPTIFIILVVLGAPELFCSIFINSNDVINVAVRYLSIVGFAYMLMPIRLMLNGFIIGTARTRFLLFSSTTASILEVIIMFVLLNIINVDSMLALGWSVLAYVFTDTLLSTFFFFGGSWKRKIIIQQSIGID